MELPLLLLVAFCAAVLLRSFAVQPFDIPSGSMEQTLKVGDRVLVNKLVHQMREPQRGEVIVFKGSDRWSPEGEPEPEGNLISQTVRVLGDLVGIAAPNEKDLIKRIIGTPGDTVMCCDAEGKVTVNGFSLDESGYVYDDAPLDLNESSGPCQARKFGPVHVPEGHVFVLGDHRGNSKDSRCQGFVPIENVIGRAINVVWPKSSWSALRIPDTFAGVPDPGEAATGEGDGDVGAGTGDEGAGFVAPLLLPAAIAGLRRRHEYPVRCRAAPSTARTLLW